MGCCKFFFCLPRASLRHFNSVTNAWGNNVWRERFNLLTVSCSFSLSWKGGGANCNSYHGVRQNKVRERISILTGFLNSHFYAIMAPSQWNVITPIQGRAFFPIILLWRHLCSLPRLFQFTEGESPNQISKFHTYLYSK